MNIHECAIDYKHGTKEDGKENPDLYQNFPDDMIFYSLEKARQKSKGTLIINNNNNNKFNHNEKNINEHNI